MFSLGVDSYLSPQQFFIAGGGLYPRLGEGLILDFDIFSPLRMWRLTKTSVSAHTNLPISIQKSPRIVPGFESNGLVSPNIIRPVRTMSLPSHTFVKKECRLKHYQTCYNVS